MFGSHAADKLLYVHSLTLNTLNASGWFLSARPILEPEHQPSWFPYQTPSKLVTGPITMHNGKTQHRTISILFEQNLPHSAGF